MAVRGIFFNLDAATLADLKTQYLACQAAILGGGQSYTVAGRQFNRAQLKDVADLFSEVLAAQARLAGTTPSQTYARFT